MKKFILYIFIAVSVLKSYPIKAQVNVQDSLALIDLYNSTNGTQWGIRNGWLTDPVNLWRGITLTNNRVTGITLNMDNLTGTLPASVGNLDALEFLDVSHNFITGNIPSSIGNLSNLNILLLNNNLFSGSIPVTLGNLQSLTGLVLQSNQLTGVIPAELGNLLQLQSLELSNNFLSGNIPVELGNLKNCEGIFISNNQLTGNIPSSFKNLKNLLSLYAYNNKLSGTIPFEISQIPGLVGLLLNYNELTFAGMEAIQQAYSFATYSPQALIPLHYDEGKLAVSAGGTLSHNTYYWYRNNVLYKTITGDSILPVVKSGVYYAMINNSVATQLTLYTDTLSVTALPVTLISFTAAKQNNNVLLQWVTTQEMNADYYEVERSTDGIHFTDLAKVTAKGSALVNNYSFTDSALSTLNLQSPTVFYRLKMFDKDRSYSMSEIRNINFNSIFVTSLYPNPAKDKLSISITATKEEVAEIQIISTEGKVVLSQPVNLPPGILMQTINVSKLAKGNYFINIKTNEGVSDEKFVKE